MANIARHQLDAFSDLVLPVIVISAACSFNIHQSTCHSGMHYLAVLPGFGQAAAPAAITEAFPLCLIHIFQLGGFPPWLVRHAIGAYARF